MIAYVPSSQRYKGMIYNRCGKSGLKLPAITLGLWQHFSEKDPIDTCRAIVRRAFDLGITHFDLANNYGAPAGSSEEIIGKILNSDLSAYRDEIIVATKAGYDMWEGPYGEWGSKKYLVASMDQSLKRMGLDYVDIFYSHRPDPETPLEETMGTLDLFVRQGKALYVGISNYNAQMTAAALKILKDLGTPCLIHQPSYSMYNRWIEDGLQDVLAKEGVGTIVFQPLQRGALTDAYLKGIPPESAAALKEIGIPAAQ
jgi:L-glyceraldehyde 3-phosphate reductase